MRNRTLQQPRSAAHAAGFITATFASLFLALVAPSARADEILQKGAKNPFKGTVLSEDLAKVKYKLDGVAQAQEIDSALVAEIVYDDAPEAFTKGRELLKKGDAENAVNSFRLALKSKTKNNWIAVHGNYQLGVALQMWGAKDAAKLKEAAAVFTQLLKDSPECRFMPDALKRSADALAAAKDAAGAAALYDRLAEVAQQRKLGIVLEAEARIRKADAYVTAGMTKEAEAAYAAAGSFADSNASTQKDESTKLALMAITGRSQLSQGAALLRNKKFAEARQFFEKVALSASAQSEVVAAALNGVGEVLLEEGKPRDALEQFARVRVQYYLAREETARATFFLGKSCLALKDAEPNGKKKAADYFAEVVERYGDTPWADRARAEIK